MTLGSRLKSIILCLRAEVSMRVLLGFAAAGLTGAAVGGVRAGLDCGFEDGGDGLKVH